MKVAVIDVEDARIDVDGIEKISKDLGVDVDFESARASINDISEMIYSLSNEGFDIIFTVGGVGVGSKDIVPEATEMVIDKRLSGLEFFVLSKVVSKGNILTRITAGTRKNSLIVNLPAEYHVELFREIVENFIRTRDRDSS